ncbi:alpha/beta hydrolase [Myroides pelagicus]|uniref:Alpha/beta fold hydrolase n=1 Tax=Myroides pelagicus TaxID=270914 RepID=A0A7K1GSC7_9FLAO|nr:alpha/beta hydrolase [Myroides pelagicus]MEC4115189.1 alpha/beta hydrolase [Myroides pelagicus]MTH30953.1 alpha/beta fold hydrolase [Myroides pelagicus]
MKKVIGSGLNVLSWFNLSKSVELAFTLFSTPRKGKIEGEFPLFLDKADKGSMLVKGQRVQYYQWNIDDVDKPLIMLIHGWESNSNRWEEVVKYLSYDQYRFIAFDAFGLGKSQGKRFKVPDFSDLIDVMLAKFSPDYVIAHSLGAFASLACLSVKSYPFIQRLVLLGGPDSFQDILLKYSKMMGYNKSITNGILDYAQGLLTMPLANYSSVCFLNGVTIPLIVIHDQSDCAVLVSECRAFHKKVIEMNNKVIFTDQLGHSLQSDEVYEYIKEFIK